MSKARYIFGIATIVGIGGFTIYAIKKAKDAKKLEESEITLEEAREIMKEREAQKVNETAEELEEDEEEDPYAEIKARVQAEIDRRENTINVVKADEYEELEEVDEDEDIDEVEEDPYEFYYSDGHNPKGDDELRYDPNSREARDQYIRMELAEFYHDEDSYHTMLNLFEFPFFPQNDGDEMLRTQILDFKVQFFGFKSKWVKDISMADIILHYARAAEFNCGETVKFWVEYFLELNELDHTRSSNQLDHVIKLLNTHTYFNEERATFGIFGLTRESMDQAIRIASMNVDRSVTYEIEFNEFLKSCI